MSNELLTQNRDANSDVNGERIIEIEQGINEYLEVILRIFERLNLKEEHLTPKDDMLSYLAFDSSASNTSP